MARYLIKPETFPEGTVINIELPIKTPCTTGSWDPGCAKELHKCVVRGSQSICGSRLGLNIVCFWEGDLAVTLEIAGQTITINDHDKRRDRTSEITIGTTTYTFQGYEVEVYSNTPPPYKVGLLFTVS